MFFYLSKFVWTVIAPLNAVFLALLVLLGVFIFVKNKTFLSWARYAAMVLGVVLGVLFLFPVGNTALYHWESRYPPLEKLPDDVTGIIVLGGEMDPYISAERNQPTTSPQTQRIYVLPELAKRYPHARIVYTGGSGYVRRQAKREADVAEDILHAWGLVKDDTVFERRSRNTWENAVFSKDLVSPHPSQTWLLITSASHMPRAHQVFNKVEWQVTPYPVDYRAAKERPFWCFCAAENIVKLQIVMHELLGLAAYRLSGKAEE